MDTLFCTYLVWRIAAACVVIAIAGCGGGGGSDEPQTGPIGSPSPGRPGTVSTTRDQLFRYQWHLHNTGQVGTPGSLLHGTAGVDLNVLPVWKRKIEGNGVTVAVVDDGIDIRHEDLKNNIAAGLSHDYVTGGIDPSPTSDRDEHGTSIAGIIAAERNANDLGGVGVAPKAKLAGFNILSEGDQILSSTELDALKRGVDDGRIDISNNSWGSLSGSVVSTLNISRVATRHGVDKGRDGKGMIYVFSAGNNRYGPGNRFEKLGPGYGWTNFRQTSMPQVLAICAVDANGVSAPYSHYGSSLLVCAPSSGDNKKTPRITTTVPFFDLYTHEFGGTSAAAAMVSGVVALMLQANPKLSWRDVRLILARTARILPNMKNDPNAHWITTQGINPYTQKPYQYSHIYGFGLVDAEAAVAYAQDFKSVGKSSDAWWNSGCVNHSEETVIGLSSSIQMSCSTKKIEFAEVEIEVEHPRFRDLKITLTTPSGTQMLLTDYYPYCDINLNIVCPTSDFGHRYITSVTVPIDEPATGTWTVNVTKAQQAKSSDPIVKDVKLTVH